MALISYPVRMISVDEDRAGQRIDQFLISQFKGVPKSFVYRILRKGEVRVNKKRIDQTYKLAYGDLVRLPPVKIEDNPVVVPQTIWLWLKLWEMRLYMKPMRCLL